MIKKSILTFSILLNATFLIAGCTFTNDADSSATDALCGRTLSSGEYLGYFYGEADSYRTIDDKLFIQFNLMTDNKREFNTEEIMSMEIGSTLVYDSEICLVVDRIEVIEWQDPHAADENGESDWIETYYRREGKIRVNDDYYFIHVPYKIDEMGRANISDEEADHWVLASDRQMERNPSVGYYVCNDKLWIPVSDFCEQFIFVNTGEQYDMNELPVFMGDNTDFRVCHGRIEIRNGEIIEMQIDPADCA